MSDYKERFRERFQAQDLTADCLIFNAKERDILAFIEEELKARDEWWAAQTAKNVGTTRGIATKDERSRILAMVEGMREPFCEDYECGGCMACEACYLYDGVSVSARNQALDDLTQKIREATDRPIPSSAENGFQEETECCPACSYTVGNGMAGCSNPNGCCHKPRTEETEKEGASFSGLVGCCADCCFYLDYKDDYQCNGGWVSENCKCHPEIAKDWDYINKNRAKETTTPQSREQGGEHVHSVDCGHCAHWMFTAGCKSCEKTNQ